ncbi:MAG: tetratricopeptide repeat protein [Chloroflexi bacterium]|nr:tetratricopeptide repeat protein [Chloroflexota bacterium]
MITLLPQDSAGAKKRQAEQAIALALQSRWEEAAAVNKSILRASPRDVDAYNRLGKALMELGRYADARDAYASALRFDPNNSIAKKNLSRLSHLSTTEETPAEPKERVDLQFFIEETGKTGIAFLQELGSQEVLAKTTAGDPVQFRVEEGHLMAETARGEYLGLIEPRIGLRLVGLMEGGNRYAGALASVSENAVRIIIKEIHQDPGQAGKLSFPARVIDGFRPYTKESLVRYGLDDDEWTEEGDSPESDEEAPTAEEEGGFLGRTERLVETEEEDEEEEF